MDKQEIEQFYADRKAEGSKIDPETAEVTWTYGHIMDPYGIDPDLPGELQAVGRIYLAKSPNNVWVAFSELPEATRDALWKKHKAEIAFPAGLFPQGGEATPPQV